MSCVLKTVVFIYVCTNIKLELYCLSFLLLYSLFPHTRAMYDIFDYTQCITKEPSQNRIFSIFDLISLFFIFSPFFFDRVSGRRHCVESGD